VAHRRRFSTLDFGLIAFYISSIISTALAYDIATAMPQLGFRTLFMLLYLTFRSSEATGFDIVIASGLGMAIHCAESLIAFSRSYREWSGLHFDALIDYRSSVTLTLHGERPGNHAAIYILALAIGFCGLSGDRENRAFKTTICTVSVGLSATCIALSFSRSLYVCSLVCIVLSAWGMKKTAHFKIRPAIVGTSAIMTTFAIVMLCVRPVAIAVRDTALFGTHLSQVRSTIGRVLINQTALHLATQTGLFGVGVSNYALEVRRRGLTSPSLLTAHAFNTTLEVAIEQGLIGLSALAAVFTGLAKIIVERIRTAQGWVLLGGSAALLLYSLCQTFLITDQATATLLAVFCAVAVQNEGQYV
jgi:hypothetical protein